MNSPLRHHRLIIATAATAVLTVTASGCGAIVERATEEAVERAVESEGGGNVDIDFDENGIQIEGTDENGDDFSLDLDENGLAAQSDGGESITLDEDGFTATDGDGDVTTGEFDTDGETTRIVVEGEDGESVFRTDTGVPAEWPNNVPRPDGLSEVNSTYQASDGTVFIIVAGQSSKSRDDFSDAYVSDLESAGFVEESTFSDTSTRGGTYNRGSENIALSVSEFDGTTEIAVTYALSK